MRFVGDSIQPFDEGDLCLLGANLLHSWHTGPVPMATESLVAQFRPELLESMATNWPELRRLATLVMRCRQGLRFGSAASKPIVRLFQQTVDAPAGSSRRLTLFIQLLEALHDCAETTVLSTASPLLHSATPTFSRMHAIMDTLHRQMPRPHSQADMAELYKMTPAAFSRFFKRVVGRSYVDYINAWRISLACRQLLQTESPITQIALACGFENLSNFNRRFRQYKNLTPGEYRRLTRVDQVISTPTG